MTTTSEDHTMADRQVARYRMLYHHDRDSYLRRTCGKPATVHFVRRYRRPGSDPRLMEVVMKIVWPAGAVTYHELTLAAAFSGLHRYVIVADPLSFVSELAVAAGLCPSLLTDTAERFNYLVIRGTLPGFGLPAGKDQELFGLLPDGRFFF